MSGHTVCRLPNCEGGPYQCQDTQTWCPGTGEEDIHAARVGHGIRSSHICSERSDSRYVDPDVRQMGGARSIYHRGGHWREGYPDRGAGKYQSNSCNAIQGLWEGREVQTRLAQVSWKWNLHDRWNPLAQLTSTHPTPIHQGSSIRYRHFRGSRTSVDLQALWQPVS